MLDSLKTFYRKLPVKKREKLSKIVWYAKRLDALVYRIRSSFKMKTPVHTWTIEGNLRELSKFKHTCANKNIIVFPVIDWYFRIQRPQHLARELARLNNNVVYLSTTFNINAEPGFKIIECIEKGLVICQLNFNKKNKSIYTDNLNKEEIAFLLKSLNAIRAAFDFGNTYSIVDLPFWSEVACSLSSNSVIYDCMDHHAGFENNSESMLKKEEYLLSKADLVITTASRLSTLIANVRDNIIIRNAAEVEYFARRNSKEVYQKKGKVVGYYGAIAEWFDLDLICYLAEHTPEIEYVIVGNVTVDISVAKKYPNIKFIGEVPYSELTAYINVFDVCLIPFKLIELTLCTNPVKVYEYLAAGKPVVATAMPEVELMSEYVHIGYSKESFLEKVHIALSESSNNELSLARQTWALQHDWSSRAKELNHEIDKIQIFTKKVSLIVLTFNNLELTKNCLSSILSNTTYNNYEVIVVDNNSTDGTQCYLQQQYSSDERFKLIFNQDNLGFAAGNNVGLRAATGDILIIINNDTYVAPYWLEPIVKVLCSSDNVGLVCPVTNNIGNEAKINIHYASFPDMAVQAVSYACEHVNETYPMECVAFFCVGMTRKTYELVGPMSEEYGLGFYEDDDYCMRVMKEGLSNFAVEESFVHHHLSASFNKLKNNKKEQLMQRNKEIFEKKWGQWKPHNYRKGVY